MIVPSHGVIAGTASPVDDTKKKKRGHGGISEDESESSSDEDHDSITNEISFDDGGRTNNTADLPPPPDYDAAVNDSTAGTSTPTRSYSPPPTRSYSPPPTRSYSPPARSYSPAFADMSSSSDDY